MSGDHASRDLLFKSSSGKQLSDCPQEYIDVCVRCWDNDMTKRPNAEVVLDVIVQIQKKREDAQ